MVVSSQSDSSPDQVSTSLQAGFVPYDFVPSGPRCDLAATAELDIAPPERVATRPIRERVVFTGTRTFFAVFFSERVTFTLDNVGLPSLSSAAFGAFCDASVFDATAFLGPILTIVRPQQR